MAFAHFYHAARLITPDLWFNEQVYDWSMKREHLQVYLVDLDSWTRTFSSIEGRPYSGNPNITLHDNVPGIRLASMCEAACNCLYSMAELSANYANKISRGVFPSSFNSIRKKAEDGSYDRSLAWLSNDLIWYKRVREIRTEWVHHSTVFIGGERDSPVVLVKCRRRPGDRETFPSTIEVAIPELKEWIRNALHDIDLFADYLLHEYVLPPLNLAHVITHAKTDANGWPIIVDKRFDVEQITIREYLLRGGISEVSSQIGD